jgi:hypothetical protein
MLATIDCFGRQMEVENICYPLGEQQGEKTIMIDKN